MAANATEIVGQEYQTEPYAGDDWSQSLARRMWFPMLAMGVMLVLGALAVGSIAGLSLGDFFARTGDADSLGRARSAVAWATGANFLGMGFILSGITMVLVNIVRTLRDSGKDVQESLHASEVVKLRKPVEGRFLPYVMMGGLMILGTALVFSVVQATKLGAIPANLLVAASGLTGENLARFGAVASIDAWLAPLRFVGLATIFGSIVLALRVIIKTLRFQSFRVTQLLAYEAPEPVEIHAGSKSNGRSPRQGHSKTRRYARSA